jgi:hypothetical protein
LAVKARVTLLMGFAVLGALTASLARLGCQQPPDPRRPRSADARVVAPEAQPTRPAATSPAEHRPKISLPRRASGEALDVIGNSDPSSTDYDPIILNRVMNTSPLELMRKEPRNQAFAGPREAALQERITERLRKRVAFDVNVQANCHTSSCEVLLEGGRGAEDMDTAIQAIDLSILSETGMVGPLASSKNGTQNSIRLIVLFSAALRDHAAYAQLLRQHKEHDESLPEKE